VKSVDLNAINSAEQAQSKKAEQAQSKKVEPARSGNTEATRRPAVSQESDQVNVSDTGMQVGRMVQRARELDEVRQERVESLRQQVNAGEYHVSADKIAEAILNEEGK